ncbi:MAG TPA: hypothetical protein VHC69_22875 [Polyangiaceae bacterium]|nr:hypothetical protein [Polyangiaceae bacterium]
MPGVVLTLLLALTTPWPGPGRARKIARTAVAVASASVAVGLARFAASKAMLGIVEGGQSATAFGALWKLREVVIAEDGLREMAPWDPDGDHVGSAALIGALAGSEPLRKTKRLDAPLLNYAFRVQTPTAIGPAARVEGYLIVVCLPKAGGGFTARPGEPVDDELAERRYVAYAWPSEAATGMTTAFFTDEHERILVLDPPRGAAAPYKGADRPPACDAALGKDGHPWKPWKGKQPRKSLPGDSAS